MIRYSAHSYVEDQDQWWMAGLHRSVWLESRPLVHIADLPIATGYDPDTGVGTVKATTLVGFRSRPEAGLVGAQPLVGPNGRQVGRVLEGSVPHDAAQPYVFRGFQVDARWEVERAKAWSAETPHCYRGPGRADRPEGPHCPDRNPDDRDPQRRGA